MTTTPIQVTGAEGILGTIPVMLGFHPTDSLVVLGLSGPRRTVGPVARIDLEPDPASIRALGDALAQHVTHAIAVIYGGHGQVTEADLHHHLGLHLLDVFRVPNTPRPVHAAVAEAAALGGRAVLQDRAARPLQRRAPPRNQPPRRPAARWRRWRPAPKVGTGSSPRTCRTPRPRSPTSSPPHKR